MLMNSLFARSASCACAIRRALRSNRAPSVDSCWSDWTAAGSNGSSLRRPIASRPIVSPPIASGATRNRRNGCTIDASPSGAPVYSAAVSSTDLPVFTPARTFGAIAGGLAFLIQPCVPQRQPGYGAQQGQRRQVLVRERVVLVPAEDQHADCLASVDERDHGDMADVGDRLPKLGRSLLAGEPATDHRLHRFDRLLDQRLAGEVVEGVPLADPCHLSVPTVGGLDDDMVVAQTGKGGAIGL